MPKLTKLLFTKLYSNKFTPPLSICLFETSLWGHDDAWENHTNLQKRRCSSATKLLGKAHFRLWHFPRRCLSFPTPFRRALAHSVNWPRWTWMIPFPLIRCLFAVIHFDENLRVLKIKNVHNSRTIDYEEWLARLSWFAHRKLHHSINKILNAVRWTRVFLSSTSSYRFNSMKFSCALFASSPYVPPLIVCGTAHCTPFLI